MEYGGLITRVFALFRPEKRTSRSENYCTALNNRPKPYTNINEALLSYDGGANLTSYSGWTYSYDSQNRLISGSNSGSNTQLRFYYDGLNRQIMRDVTVNGTLTRQQFVYDGWNLIQEHNGAGTLQACYLHGAGTDELLMRFGGTSPLVWYHGDGRGNVARISDGSGKVSERYTYGLGGIPTITDPSGGARTVSWCNNRFLFQGRDYIKEAGLYDYRNRFYHPVLNRFLQPDPIGFAGDPSNIYRYAGNDPVNGRDPSGLGADTHPTPPKPCGTGDCIIVRDTPIADGTQGGLSWNGGTGWDTLRGNNISGVDFGRSSPGMFDHSEFNIRTGVNTTPAPILPDIFQYQSDATPSSDSSFTVRGTFYNQTEAGADSDTIAGITSTSTPLGWAGDGYNTPGIAAVDPKLIAYGSTIITADGRRFIAADTGGAVRSQTASGGFTPVIDYFSVRQVGFMWDRVIVVPYGGLVPYTDLRMRDKRGYFRGP